MYIGEWCSGSILVSKSTGRGSIPCSPAILGGFMSYLLDRLQKLDKDIAEAERALIHLNKQAGAKLEKIKRLKAEREEVSSEYKEAANG